MKEKIPLHLVDEISQNEVEEWEVLFSTLRITYMLPSFLQHYYKSSYDIYFLAYFMNESIKRTRNLNKTRLEIIQKFQLRVL